MKRITTALALAALLLGGLVSTAPAQATAPKQTQTCAKCATGIVRAAKAGAPKTAKAAVRLAAATASCCTGGSCCPECPTCCENGTCNTGKCPNGCCNTAACQSGAACCK